MVYESRAYNYIEWLLQSCTGSDDPSKSLLLFMHGPFFSVACPCHKTIINVKPFIDYSIVVQTP